MASVQLMPMVDVPFHNVTIDLISSVSPLTDRRNQWILTLVDCATRYAEAIPLSSTTTEVVAEALLSIFTRVGFPNEVLNGNGPQFVLCIYHNIGKIGLYRRKCLVNRNCCKFYRKSSLHLSDQPE